MAQQNFLDSTRRSVAQIKKHWDKGELEIRPPFQRNPVWSNKQKSYLIDTMLHGYPIPEIYVSETVDQEGELHFTIVDGQQRIRACLEFVEGRFGLSDPEDSSWLDKTFDQLSKAEREQVFGYNFMVRQLPSNMPEVQLIDIFKRINRNTVSLNKQELRHATYWGEFIKSMESISDDELWESISIFSANDIRRMLDVEFISELAIAIMHGHQNKKSALDTYYVLYETEFDQRKEIENLFRIVLAEVVAILSLGDVGRWRKKSDFYSLFIGLAELLPRMPFTSTVRKRVGARLRRLGEEVDSHLKDEDARISKSAVKYGRAVQRAASDLANRRARHEVMSALLNGATERA